MTDQTPIEEFTEAYHKGSATGNAISGAGAIASLIAAGLAPTLVIPTVIAAGSEGVGQLARHTGINKAIREKMLEKGYEFNESPHDSNAIARSVAGALMATGLPLGHAALETMKEHKNLKATMPGFMNLKPSTRAAASFGKALSKPKTLALSLLAGLIGAHLAPHAARIIGGNPFDEAEELDAGVKQDVGDINYESI